VAELLELWQALNRPLWRPATVVNQASRAKLIADGPLGRRAVDSLRVEDVDRWVLRLRADGTGTGSIHNQMLVLRAALAQAVRWKWITRNPAALASPVRRAAPDRLAMSDADVLAVIKAAPHPAAALALAPRASGPRSVDAGARGSTAES
jgi:hypothetical protein